MKPTAYAIILFTLSSLITGQFRNRTRQEWSWLLLLSFPFLLIALRTLLLDPTEEALKYFETSLSLVALPFCWFLTAHQFDKKDLRTASDLFVSSLLLRFGYGILMTIVGVSQSDKITDLNLLSYQIRTLFEETCRYHPTYASLLLGLGIIILMNRVLHEPDRRWIHFLVVLMAFLLQGVLASRTAIAGTMIAIVLLSILSFKSLKKSIITISILAVAGLVFFQFVPSFKARFNEVSVNNTSIPKKNQEDSFNLRSGIFHCSIEIIKTHWLWGVGPGNIHTELNRCYDTIAKEVYEGMNFNTHNQLMGYWLGLGVAGPLSMIAIFILCFASFFRSGNFMASTIILFFFIAMQTENILDRQNGVVPFAYFIGLQLFSMGAERHKKPHPTEGNPLTSGA